MSRVSNVNQLSFENLKLKRRVKELLRENARLKEKLKQVENLNNASLQSELLYQQKSPTMLTKRTRYPQGLERYYKDHLSGRKELLRKELLMDQERKSFWSRVAKNERKEEIPDELKDIMAEVQKPYDNIPTKNFFEDSIVEEERKKELKKEKKKAKNLRKRAEREMKRRERELSGLESTVYRQLIEMKEVYKRFYESDSSDEVSHQKYNLLETICNNYFRDGKRKAIRGEEEKRERKRLSQLERNMVFEVYHHTSSTYALISKIFNISASTIAFIIRTEKEQMKKDLTDEIEKEETKCS